MASPKPIPTAIAKIGPDTSKGKRKLSKQEPKPAVATIIPPEWLTGNGRVIWNKLSPEAVRVGLLTLVDVFPFARYCVAMADWLECQAAIQDPKRSPDQVLREGWIKRRREADALLLRYEGEFGFTPSSRCKLQVTPPQAADPMDEFVDGPPLRLAE